MRLLPKVISRVVQRVGIVRVCSDETAPIMEEIRKARTGIYGVVRLKKADEGHEEDSSSGVMFKHND